ncbi:MAG: SDR family oxidoreductase [Nitrospirota bacterium]
MNIAVFGASGRTGRHLLKQGLERGHAVTAFVRNPARLRIAHDNLSVVQGDVLHPAEVEAAVKGRDAVLSALGLSKGSPKTICADGTGNIISAMKRHGVKRLVVQSAFGAGETRKRGLYARLLWILIAPRMKDKEAMEAAVRESGLQWVIVRPVRLTDGPETGSYRTGTRLKPGPFPKVSRADVADFMLRQMQSDEFLRQAPTITG